MKQKSLEKPKFISRFFSVLTIGSLIAGTLSSLFSASTAYANNGLSVSAVPNTGTLTPGQTLEVRFSDPTGTTAAVADTCLVNGVEVKDTFTNVSPGLYRATYTVGASDQSRAGGQVPINCTLHEANSLTVTAFDDGNTVAIDTTGGSAPVTPVISEVSITPSTGTSTAGDIIYATFREASGATDLALAGTCQVNAVDVSNSFTNQGGGLYRVSYTVSPGDGERPAGHIPVGCTLGNSAGNATIGAWNDGNTLAIDTNNDGAIDNGTSTLGFTVAASPSTGTLIPGQTVHINIQDPLPSPDVVINPTNGCLVNGVDVSSTYAYQGNGLYSVDYTVGATDQNRAAGEIPFDCTLQNHTGSVHLTYFTDANTLAVNTSGNSGGGSTTTPSTLAFNAVTAVPNTGNLVPGNQLEVLFWAPVSENNLTLNGACTVNGVNVSGTFANLTDGQYRVVYTVGSTDQNRPAGTVPVNCSFVNGAGATTTASAFTDSNSVAIMANSGGTPGGGSTSTPTTTPDVTPIVISSVTSDPVTGILHQGSHVLAYIQEGNNAQDLSIGGACKINGVSLGNLENLNNGLYRLDYTIGSNDSDRAAGGVPISCVLQNSSGATTTISAFTVANTVAIDVHDDGIGSATGGSMGGDVVGGADASLAVSSIEPVSTTAVAGGGYEDGWEWIIRVTVPSNETKLSVKFSDWTHTNGTSHLSAGGNMRVSSAQASSNTPVEITASDTYSLPLDLTGDLDSSVSGRQIELRVQMKVPSDILNGSYTTNYGIRSSQ